MLDDHNTTPSTNAIPVFRLHFDLIPEKNSFDWWYLGRIPDRAWNHIKCASFEMLVNVIKKKNPFERKSLEFWFALCMIYTITVAIDKQRFVHLPQVPPLPSMNDFIFSHTPQPCAWLAFRTRIDLYRPKDDVKPYQFGISFCLFFFFFDFFFLSFTHFFSFSIHSTPSSSFFPLSVRQKKKKNEIKYAKVIRVCAYVRARVCLHCLHIVAWLVVGCVHQIKVRLMNK